jgi:glutamyl-Q tRNA(Asp) synthetase
VIPPATRTRFAPAPTGRLHLGHVANALWVWGAARLAGAGVLLRIEDHDRGRSRPEFDRTLIDDLAWLGFVPDEGPIRQSDDDAEAAYADALARLAADGMAYRCGCSRATFAAWARDHARAWTGAGCPGACRTRVVPAEVATSTRVALGGDDESFDDLVLERWTGPVAAGGDLVARDRAGNWSYPFAVVVDDLRQGVDLVVRGDDLVADTPRQIRLARILGRARPPCFLHHPLIRKASGAKLSKSDGDTGVDELRRSGWSQADVRSEAASRGKIPAAIVDAAGRGV